MPRTIPRYGWNPDIPDQRDHLYATPPACLTSLPPRADLRKGCPPVYDQGQLGSCTANALAAAFQFDERKQKVKNRFTPSRLFIYYNERAIEGTVAADSGAMLRDGIKTLVHEGVCPEQEWPYDIAKFTRKPTKRCYTDASTHKATSYQRLVQSLQQMKGCLHSGYPFVFGITVYESFESNAVAKTGKVPMPAQKEKALGGHAVLAVGYDDSKQSLIVRNSWGPGWGDKGYFTLPYAYASDPNLAGDFWTVRLVQQ
jgi:C1A family cysteine protease